MTSPIGFIVQIVAILGSTTLIAGFSTAAAMILGQSF